MLDGDPGDQAVHGRAYSHSSAAVPEVDPRCLPVAPEEIVRMVEDLGAHEFGEARTIFPELTDREREILNLIAAGRNNGEIAGELFLSLKTIRNYVSNIFTKLQVADRAQAMIRAREAGLGRYEGHGR